jgi:hypothetical protein
MTAMASEADMRPVIPHVRSVPLADFRHTYNHSARVTADDLVEATCKAARAELQSDEKVQALGFRVLCVEP